MTDTYNPEPEIPNVAPLVEDLVGVATNSLQRAGDQALDIWNQITSGDYEPKHVVRDTAIFWAEATKDIAKAFVLVRDFLARVAAESDADTAR